MKHVRWPSQEQADYIHKLRKDITLLQITVFLANISIIILALTILGLKNG